MWAKSMLLADHAWKHATERREKAEKRRAAAVEAEAQDQFRKIAWQQWCKQRINMQPLPETSSSSSSSSSGSIMEEEQRGHQQQQEQEEQQEMLAVGGKGDAEGTVVDATSSSSTKQS